jgi:hypothetical protein
MERQRRHAFIENEAFKEKMGRGGRGISAVRQISEEGPRTHVLTPSPRHNISSSLIAVHKQSKHGCALRGLLYSSHHVPHSYISSCRRKAYRTLSRFSYTRAHCAVCSFCTFQLKLPAHSGAAQGDSQRTRCAREGLERANPDLQGYQAALRAAQSSMFASFLFLGPKMQTGIYF